MQATTSEMVLFERAGRCHSWYHLQVSIIFTMDYVLQGGGYPCIPAGRCRSYHGRKGKAVFGQTEFVSNGIRGQIFIKSSLFFKTRKSSISGPITANPHFLFSQKPANPQNVKIIHVLKQRFFQVLFCLLITTDCVLQAGGYPCIPVGRCRIPWWRLGRRQNNPGSRTAYKCWSHFPLTAAAR